MPNIRMWLLGAFFATMAFVFSPLMAVAGTAGDNPFYQAISPTCVYNTAFNLTTGQVVSLTCDNTGALRVNLASGSITVNFPFSGSADNQAPATSQGVAMMGFDGTNFDRLRVFGVAGTSGLAAPTGGLAGVVSVGHCEYSTATFTYTSGNIYPVTCDSSGNLRTTASLQLPFPGSGSVAAGSSQGVGIWGFDGTSNLRPILQGTIAPQTGAGAPAYGMMWGVQVPECFYSTTAASPTNNTVIPVQCNANGQLLTTGQQAPLSEATSAPVGSSQGVGVQYVNGTVVQPVSSANPLPVNCYGGCSLPFNGTSDAQSGGSSQGLAMFGFNGATFDRIRSSGVTGQAGVAAPTIGLLGTVSYPNCVYSTTAITPTNGNAYPLQCDVNGDLMASAPWKYAVITTSGATVVKSSAGILGGIFNLSTSAQAAGTCTGYDNTLASGTIIFQENQIGANQQYNEPTGGLVFGTGFTMNCAVAPNTGLLVQYR